MLRPSSTNYPVKAGTEHTESSAGTHVNEHTHHHVHEHIQPVIQKETHEVGLGLLPLPPSWEESH